MDTRMKTRMLKCPKRRCRSVWLATFMFTCAQYPLRHKVSVHLHSDLRHLRIVHVLSFENFAPWGKPRCTRLR